MRVHLEAPADGDLCDPLCLRLEGWIQTEPGEEPSEAVEFFLNGRKLGATALLAKPGPAGRAAFSYFAAAEDPPFGRPARLEAVATRGGPVAATVRDVRLLERDYRRNHYGVLLEAGQTVVFRRENIYGSGPSQPGGSEEVLALLRRHLGPPSRKIVDIGCGLGWYGIQLRGDGHDWTGAEVKAGDCAELAKQGLPHRQVDGAALPFTDGAFDVAMAIEVLEHIEQPEGFLAEARRVAPHRLLISVPNVELIPYLQDYQAVPWHLLELDHKNFFTRQSLAALLGKFYPRAEVMCYHRHPLATPEGLPLYYHLFAVAWAP